MNFSSSQLIWFIFSGDKPSERSTATDVPCCKLAKLTTTGGTCESDLLLFVFLVFFFWCFCVLLHCNCGNICRWEPSWSPLLSPRKGRRTGTTRSWLSLSSSFSSHHHYHYQLKHNMIWNQVELGVSCQLDKQGGEPDDRGLMILPLTVSDNHIIFKFHDA